MRIFSGSGANQTRMRRSDDPIRTDVEKSMIRRRQAAHLCYAALYFRVGWIRIAMDIRAEERTVELRIDVGVPVELYRCGGRRGVFYLGD